MTIIAIAAPIVFTRVESFPNQRSIATRRGATPGNRPVCRSQFLSTGNGY
jgi:hypothetical protein